MTAAYIQSQTEFDVLLETEPVLVVDCTAPWCGPCKLIAPLIDQLAQEYSDRAKVLKLDLDTNQPIAKRFGIRSIPAVMLFKHLRVGRNDCRCSTLRRIQQCCG